MVLFLNTNLFSKKRMKKREHVKYVLKTQKKKMISYLTLANVLDHVELFISTVFFSGSVLKSRKKLLEAPCTITSKNLNVRSVKLNCQLELKPSKTRQLSCFQSKNQKETMLFLKAHVKRPKVS